MRLEVTVSMTVLILLGRMVALATTYPAEVRLVPLVVGIPGTVLAAWQTAGVMRRAAGARPSEVLMLLHARIEAALVRIGLEPERRKFHPHVTLARLRGAPRDRVGRFLADHGRYESPPFIADSFVLCSRPPWPACGRAQTSRAPPPWRRCSGTGRARR